MPTHHKPKGPTQGQVVLPWHGPVIRLRAEGYGARAIATKTGLNVRAIKYALASPAVIDAVEQVRQASFARLGTQIAERILRDAPKNLAFLEQVRDNMLDDARADVRDRVTAAIRLLDSQLPRKTSSTQRVSGQIGVGVQVVSHEDALDITALARDAGIELPALPAPETE